MPVGYLFWVVWTVALLVCGWLEWPNRRGLGASVIVFILLALLGWQVFGPIVQGAR